MEPGTLSVMTSPSPGLVGMTLAQGRRVTPPVPGLGSRGSGINFVAVAQALQMTPGTEWKFRKETL